MLSSNTARLLLAALLFAPSLALAQAQDAATYDKCLALARKDPAEGFETGSSWRDHGGGVPAEHCVAIALVGLKQYGEAATRLEKLAGKMVRESDALRAEVLSQAAEAWSEGGQPKNAESDLTEAIKLAPKNAEYLVNRSAARAQHQDYKNAVDDLNKRSLPCLVHLGDFILSCQQVEDSFEVLNIAQLPDILDRKSVV